MRFGLSLILFFLFFGFSKAQVQNFNVPKISSDAKISLLTVGVGEEIYQLFGHTGIRIKDEKLGWDLVYNYGTFDFYDPNFIKKFIKGELDYFLSVDDFNSFMNEYVEENRSVHEQVLDLDSSQIQKIFEFLTTNAREEYKYYRYDFLYDNCATRPRDVIVKVLFKEQLKFKPDVDDEATYRELIDRHNTNEWLDFGMDLGIGLPTDKKAGYGRTFLPFELQQLIEGATLNGKPIVLSSTQILDTIPEHHSKFWLTPSLIFWVIFLFFFILQIKQKFNDVLYKIVSVTFFTILGFLGWLFIYFWFGTNHSTTYWNLNILWAMPLNLPIAFFILSNKYRKWVHQYFFVYRMILVVLLCGWGLNPQQYHIAVVPLLLLAILLSSKYLTIPTSKEIDR